MLSIHQLHQLLSLGVNYIMTYGAAAIASQQKQWAIVQERWKAIPFINMTVDEQEGR
jgi:hypothetical protein